jgi:hypothetical protein
VVPPRLRAMIRLYVSRTVRARSSSVTLFAQLVNWLTGVNNALRSPLVSPGLRQRGQLEAIRRALGESLSARQISLVPLVFGMETLLPREEHQEQALYRFLKSPLK